MKKLLLIACAAVVFIGCRSTHEEKEKGKMNEPAGAQPSSAQYRTNAVINATGGTWTTAP